MAETWQAVLFRNHASREAVAECAKQSLALVLCDIFSAICEVERSRIPLTIADFEVKCARYFKSMLSPLYQARHLWKSLAQDSNIQWVGSLGASAAEENLTSPSCEIRIRIIRYQSTNKSHQRLSRFDSYLS